MIAGISAAVAAASFSCLVFYGIKTMKKLMTSLDETQKTIAEVRVSAKSVIQEATSTIHTLNDTVKDVKVRLNNVDPLLESAHDMGDVLHKVTMSVKKAVGLNDVIEQGDVSVRKSGFKKW